MLPFEEKFRNYLKKNAETVFMLLVTLGGVAGRFFLWDIYTGDMGAYLKWYNRAKECGGLPGIYELGQRIKGYNALFQLLTAALTHLPVDPQYMFKIVWTVFDLLLAAGVGVLVYHLCTDGGKLSFRTAKNKPLDKPALRKAAIAYALSFMSMNVIFNSAAWGQSDAVYVSLIIWSLVWILRDKPLRSFILLGLAFAFKLQTVFILPFFVFLYVYKKSFSCLYFLCLPAMLFVSALPRQIVGLLSPMSVQAAGNAAGTAVQTTTAKGLPGIINVYIGQIASGGRMYLEYPSFWAFFPNEDPDVFTDFYKFRNAAVVLTLMILAALVYMLLKEERKFDNCRFIYAAMVLSFTTVYFLPTMIDRYGYIYEILAIVLIFLDKRSIIPAALLHLVMFYQIAGRVGMETLPVSMQQLSFILLIIYGMYLYLLFGSRKEESNAGV